MLGFVAGSLCLSELLLAATFTANSTVDAVDVVIGDGLCETAIPGQCTLRAAIQEANSTVAPDVIVLPAGTYLLTIAGFNEDAAVTGDLDINENLTITGAGAATTILNGGGLDRIFHVGPTASGIVVSLSGLTVTNGIVPASTDLGGGIFSHDFSATNLTLTDVVITGNTAENGGGLATNSAGPTNLNRVTVSNNIAFDLGGGILALDSPLLVTASTVSGNSAYNEGGGIVMLQDGGFLVLTNSTVSGNSGTTTSGGLLISATSTANLNNVTIANNTAPLGGGLAAAPSAVVNVSNSLLSGNGGGNCAGTIGSSGNNLDSAATCGFVAPGDLSNSNPNIGVLANNGGPTFTHALLAGSPAIDAGNNATCSATDQRGSTRPIDGNGDTLAVCDIGAFELASNGGQTICSDLQGFAADNLIGAQAAGCSVSIGESATGGGGAFDPFLLAGLALLYLGQSRRRTRVAPGNVGRAAK